MKGTDIISQSNTMVHDDATKAKYLLLTSFLIVAAIAAENERQKAAILNYYRYRKSHRQLLSRCRTPRVMRKTWSEFRDSIDNLVFRRMFRMSKSTFGRLCEKICETVGEEDFRPEEFVQSGAYLPRLQNANNYNGGFISGNLKVAIAVWLLAGASYLDLMFGFSISRATLYREFDVVIQWINSIFQFSLPKLLKNKDTDGLRDISNNFAEFSGGVFNGIIGALDGIAIRINCPSAADGIIDPGNYWTRKQFYALNVQAICDSKKRFLWVSTGHQGSTHDSVAFERTKLCQNLKEDVAWLREQGFFWSAIQRTIYPRS
jgi:hypothetical protein